MHASIKLRVTLWYTLLSLMMVLIIVLFMFTYVRNASLKHVEELLLIAMGDAAGEVSVSEGVPRLRMDDVSAHTDNVTFVLLDDAGALWQGHWPAFELPFSDGEVRRVQGVNGSQYLVQDILLELEGERVWLRGYTPMDTMRFIQSETLFLLMICLPLMLLLSALGGYLLTRRAFRPVSVMAQRAASIVKGQDLSVRFPISGNDELSMLAGAFNSMFERLSAAFERETRFTNDAAHELRTPVAVISACAEHALDENTMEAQTAALQTIVDKANLMRDMLAQMLALSRMEAGRTQAVKEQVAFGALVLSVCEEWREAYAAANVALYTADVVQDVSLLGDELMLMRLTIQLMDNSLKYTRAGGWVKVSLTQNMDAVTLTVRDTGIGMDEQTLPHIFERFYQANAAHSGDGAGLGLSMAQLIARMHGGDITAQSVLGEGTAMTVTLKKN